MPPPGANGEIMRTGFTGHAGVDCAAAGVVDRANNNRGQAVYEVVHEAVEVAGGIINRQRRERNYYKVMKSRNGLFRRCELTNRVALFRKV